MLRSGRRRHVEQRGRGRVGRRAPLISPGRSLQDICEEQSESFLRDKIHSRADNGAEGSSLASVESQRRWVD